MTAAAPPIQRPTLAERAGASALQSLPGPVTIDSAHDYETTIARLDAAIGRRPLKVFSVIDHAGSAATIGQTIAPSRLLIFGNPELGTAFLKANPAFGQELPLKILVFNAGEATRIAFPNIGALAEAYGISAAAAPVEQVATTLETIIEETALP